MADQVVMPKQGNTVESCIILQWRRKEGDEITAGDVLCEVESDKAAFEVESTASGTLLKRYYQEGEDVPVFAPIAVIGKRGEKVSDLSVKPVAASASGARAETAVPADAGVAGPSSARAAAPQAGAHNAPGRITASPRARRLAGKMSLDLSLLTGTGTGPGGRILERDVRAALESPGRGARAEGQASSLETRGDGYPGEVREYPVKGVRKIVAERMAASLKTTAQLTLNASADARSILACREKLKSSKEELGLTGITMNDLVLYAAIRTLKRHPALNAHFLGDRIVEFASVHAAFAVDTERGLLVPVIRFADRMSLRALSAETTRLSELCANGGINPDDLSGGTITVSNLGVLGVETFTPILNPPQTAILGICNIQNKPVLSDGGIALRPYIGLSLTVDHQAVDGAPAARYLKDLCDTLADFELSLAG